MKLSKIVASASAVAIALAAMATTASASLKVIDQNGKFRSGTGSWMPVIYSDQTFDASEKDYTDYGIDCTKIATVEVTLTADDPDFFEGAFGGAIVLSSKSESNGDHNWNGKEFWGTIDEERGIETQDPAKAVVFEKTGDLEYTGVMTVDDTNCVYEGYQLVQIAVQEWGQDMSEIVVKSMVLKDASGNVMLSFDETGAAILPSEEAPAAGDVAAATDSSKGSPDTGIADVAAVAGLAIVAGGAVLVSRKRK